MHQCEITNLTINRAIEIACDVRLHRSFILPANQSSGRDRPIRVTYSDAGRDPEPADGLHKPVVLWAGGMFGGRYQAYIWDEIAQDYGIRIIAVDRPGIGGTGVVPLEHRMATWLDIVPALLNHLDIKYIGLASHSAGTMYILSTVMHLRHLLHPDKPYIALFGPWVPPQYSGRWAMRALQAFPSPLISSWDDLAMFVHRYIGPFAGVCKSGFCLAKQMSVATAATFKKKREPAIMSQEEIEDYHRFQVLCAVQHLITKYIFSENIEGSNDEALLCLEKGKTNWNGLAEALQKIASSEGVTANTTSGDRRKLRIQVFYAENDEMIGKGGAIYLDSCLKLATQGGAVQCDRFELEGTEHNSVLHCDFGGPDVMMAYLCGTSILGMNTGRCKRKAD
jgi:pimeloyl-ACP methyl ester carboxylesterase